MVGGVRCTHGVFPLPPSIPLTPYPCLLSHPFTSQFPHPLTSPPLTFNTPSPLPPCLIPQKPVIKAVLPGLCMASACPPILAIPSTDNHHSLYLTPAANSARPPLPSLPAPPGGDNRPHSNLLCFSSVKFEGGPFFQPPLSGGFQRAGRPSQCLY